MELRYQRGTRRGRRRRGAEPQGAADAPWGSTHSSLPRRGPGARSVGRRRCLGLLSAVRTSPSSFSPPVGSWPPPAPVPAGGTGPCWALPVPSRDMSGARAPRCPPGPTANAEREVRSRRGCECGAAAPRAGAEPGTRSPACPPPGTVPKHRDRAWAGAQDALPAAITGNVLPWIQSADFCQNFAFCSVSANTAAVGPTPGGCCCQRGAGGGPRGSVCPCAPRFARSASLWGRGRAGAH